MKIKRLIIFITIIIFSLSLLSCNSARSMLNDRLSELNGSSDDEIADTSFQKIIESLENRDKEALKKLFSTEALKEATDIDGGIDYIMDFYNGKMISKKNKGVGRFDSINYGKKESKLDCMYIVTTDKDTYIVYFIDQIIDNKNPDNVGIYNLQIIKESEKGTAGGGDKTKYAGIYHPNTKN